MRLLLFNPESDLALAANDPHYTPPASARRMAEDLQMLPALWAEDGDAILLHDGTLANASDLELCTSVVPWGWNPLVARRLRDVGVPPSLLPSEAWLATYREIAGRATVAIVLSKLRNSHQLAPWQTSLIGEALVCRNIEEARTAHARFGTSMFKQPWSGSGRGLHPATSPILTAKTEAWIARTLRTQGYVMAEPIYNKVQDLAAEFWCHSDGSITFEGLSLFLTTPGGVYDGNLVASEEMKRDFISRFIPLTLLDDVIATLRDFLNIASAQIPYVGPIGIDMMIIDGTLLHPCVEINWRMTMGMVALHIHRREPSEHPRCFNIVCQDGHYKAVLEAKSPKIDSLVKKL